MGKPWSEARKVETASKKIEAKAAKELGPLFADQVPVVDRAELQQERRWGLARNVEHLHEREGGQYALDILTIQRLEDLARAHLPADTFTGLHAYAYRVYPPGESGYKISFWSGILTGRQKVVFSVQRISHGFRDGEIQPGIFSKIEKVQLIEDGVFPPEGWTPPFSREQLEHTSWRKCKECKLYHAPGQVECILAPTYGEEINLDAWLKT